LAVDLSKEKTPGSMTGVRVMPNTKEHSKIFFVILSVAKNLFFKGVEIRNEAALRSE
jgi:hypothetical protein